MRTRTALLGLLSALLPLGGSPSTSTTSHPPPPQPRLPATSWPIDLLASWHPAPPPAPPRPATPPQPAQHPIPAPVAPQAPTPALTAASTPIAPPPPGAWSGPWACIAQHESGGNPATDTGNGYWGGLQFTPGTWWAYARPLGITVPAYLTSAQVQEAVADRVLAAQGWGAWPVTSRLCGL